MALPNAVVLGVAKAGTTTLYHSLGAHPQVAVSRIREPNFLFFAGSRQRPAPGHSDRLPVRTLEQYESLYAGRSGAAARVDISPIYFARPDQTILGIRQYVPAAKLIIVYRQPVDRAYSAFVMHVRDGTAPVRDFADAVKDGGADGRGGCLGGSLYADRTRKYLAAFPREQLHFLLFDDLVRDPGGFFRSVCRILGVAEDPGAERSAPRNAGAWPKHGWIHRTLSWRLLVPPRVRRLFPAPIRARLLAAVRSIAYRPPPALDPELRRELTGRFRRDILELQDLIGCDLSVWLQDGA